MKFKIQIISAILVLGVLAACNYQSCKEGTTCIAGTNGPSPIPSATPTPTPDKIPTPVVVDSSCIATCNIYSLTLDEAVSIIPVDKTQRFNMTPYTQVNICDANGKPTNLTKLVKTTKECDDGRAGEVVWKSSTNSLEISDYGFAADVKRKATGDSTLTVSLQGKSYSRVIH